MLFANFMRLLAPPPRREGPQVERGRQVFEKIGCAVCHHAGFKAESPIGAIDGRIVEAILRHANQASAARNAFQALSSADKEKLLEFLASI